MLPFIQAVFDGVGWAQGVLITLFCFGIARLFGYLRQRLAKRGKKERRAAKRPWAQKLCLAGMAASAALCVVFLVVTVVRIVTLARLEERMAESPAYEIVGVDWDGLTGGETVFVVISPEGGAFVRFGHYYFLGRRQLILDAMTSGGWVVYFDRALTEGADNGSLLETLIYRTRGDGSHRTLLARLDGWMSDIVSNDGTYCIFGMAGAPGVYRVDVANGVVTQLMNRNVRIRSYDGDAVYYHDEDDGGRLYRMSETGAGVTRMTDDGARNAAVDGDWVYYENADDGWRIYRVHTKTFTREVVTADSTAHTGFALLDRRVYYINGDDGGLYSIDMSGDPKTREGLSKYGGYDKCVRGGEEIAFWANAEGPAVIYAYDPVTDSTDEPAAKNSIYK